MEYAKNKKTSSVIIEHVMYTWYTFTRMYDFKKCKLYPQVE